MQYWEYAIQVKEENKEIALAFLEDTPLDSFVESPDGWFGYLAADHSQEAVEETLLALQNRMDLSWTCREIADENWNAVWESNFQPMQVGAFCGLRASFHPPMEAVQYEIIIDPKMAFGTGHHETTFQMIQWMERLKISGQGVLDYGCGTGVLAMLAKKMQAQRVVAIDYDPKSTENTLENAVLNGVELQQVLTGELEVVAAQSYDLILANINRNVILASLQSLYAMLPEGGQLLTSGFYEGDIPRILERATGFGFNEEGRSIKNEWACLLLIK